MPYDMAVLGNWLFAGLVLLLSMDVSDWFSDSDTPDAAGDDLPGDMSPDRGSTQIGSNDDEVFEGTELADSILAMGGQDVVSGFGGDDSLEGNTGDDVVFGGNGDDRIAGGADDDQVFGGAGADTLSVDRLDSDADWSRGEAETIDGGDGDDRLVFSMDDTATGGAGADLFEMVLDDEGGGAHIADFSADEDALVIYAPPPETGSHELLVETDIETDTTSVLLDGATTVTLDGQFTAEELNIEVRALEELNLL